MRAFPYILIFFLLISIETAISEKLSSFEGLHFYVGFMQNEVTRVDPSIPVDQKIFMSAQENAIVRIEMPYEGNTYSLFLKKDSIYTIDVNPFYETTSSEIVNKNKLIYIQSNVPLTVYAFSSQEKTSDSYSAIPVSFWGTHYNVVTVPNDTYSDPKELLYNRPRKGQFLIMAHDDETEVNITPTNPTDRGKTAGEEFSVILDKGESYLVKSQDGPKGFGDLTGTKIASNKPIGVLSGHVRASIPVGIAKSLDSKDHLIEMLMPKRAWGSSFVSIPFGVNSLGDYFKAVSESPGVNVSIETSGGIVDQLTDPDNNSVIYDKINEPAIWQSSEPIQLAQFMMRTEEVTDKTYSEYDPSMVFVVPTEQLISYVNFHTPGKVLESSQNQFLRHYVLIVAENSALNTLKFDDELLKDKVPIAEQQVLNSEYHYAKVQIEEGVHTLESETGNFSGILFGVGKYDSYAFILGAALTRPGAIDETSPLIDYTTNCFTINGEITEEINENNFGISHIIVDEENTFNFNYNFENIEPNDTEVLFTANVQNAYGDGRLLFDVYDKNGNVERFDHNHDAINFDIPQEFDLGQVDWKDSLCFELEITNLSEVQKTIENITITGDNRISFYSDDLPFDLNKGATSIVQICIDPDNVDGIAEAVLNVDLGCGIVYNTNIIAEIVGTGLIVRGHDFGEVRLDDEVCESISITNNGNITVEIISIDDTEIEGVYSIDQSILPYNLDVGETIELPACFIPDSKGIIESDLKVINQFNIEKSATLTGVGIAPDISSVVYDFGEKRVGTDNYGTVYIVNKGDADIRISFDSFAANTVENSDAIINTLTSIQDINIPKNDSIGLQLNYKSDNIGNYRVNGLFTTDWGRIQSINVDVLGFGTLPEIETNDVIFDDAYVYSESSKTEKIIFSTGNEDLTILSAFIIDGEEDSFEFDITDLQNRIIESGDSYSLPVKFMPTTRGNHFLRLGISHDANPDYGITTDTVNIIGNAIYNTESGLQITHTNDELYQCNYGSILLTIQNISDLIIELNGFDIRNVSENVEYEILTDIQNEIPRLLQPGENYSIELRVMPQTDVVEITATFETFEGESEDYNISIPVTTLKNEINNIETVSSKIGDSYKLNFSGTFPSTTETVLIKPELSISIRQDLSLLQDKEIDLNLKSLDGTESKLKMIIKDYNLNKLILESTEEISLNEETNWNLELEFISLLSDALTDDITAVISSNNCFLPDTTNFLLNFEEICNFNLRNVKLIANLPNVNISPNPIYKKLNLGFNIKVRSELEVTLTDQLGKTVTLQKSKLIEKGDHQISYDIPELSSGVYFVKIRLNANEYNKLVIISN